MSLYIYLYEGKPLISDILGKTYAKTLQSMVVLCDFFRWGQKNIRNTEECCGWVGEVDKSVIF